jgi:putative resolvase
MSNIDELYTPKQAAVLLNVSRQTLWTWIKKRDIRAVKLPSGRYRIPKSEVARIMRGEQ